MYGGNRPRAEEPSAGTIDIKRRCHSLEPSAVLSETGSEAAAQPSNPKPPKSENRRRQIVRMILKNNEEEDLVVVLLDCEATIPLLNKLWAQKRQILIFKQTEPKIVENFTAKIEPNIRLVYTFILRLQ
jgi:hypothetical protein